jgi:hypothetical protein
MVPSFKNDMSHGESVCKNSSALTTNAEAELAAKSEIVASAVTARYLFFIFTPIVSQKWYYLNQ